jgi:hypothetical protein
MNNNEAIHRGFVAGLTLAANLCSQRSDQLNSENGSTELIKELSEMHISIAKYFGIPQDCLVDLVEENRAVYEDVITHILKQESNKQESK